MLQSEFLDCRTLTLEKKRQLCKGFFLNIFFFVITSRKVSAVYFLKKGAPLCIFPTMFSKVLLQLFQSTIMKWSMTKFGSVLECWDLYFIKKWFHQRQFVEIFGDTIIPIKSLQWIPILVASNNISKKRLVHRRYPSVHCDKY